MPDTVATPPSTGASGRPVAGSALAWTSYLRIVAILGVVAIHIGSLPYATTRHGSGAWWVSAFLIYATKWAVPVFVMVSGALLLRPPADPSPGAFYRRRLARVGIPMAFWLAVYAALTKYDSPRYTINGMTSDFLRGETYTAMYFFWLILGLYLITPLLWPLTREWTGRRLIVAALAVAWLPDLDIIARAWIGQLMPEPAPLGSPTILTHFVPWIGYFLLGYALRDVVVRGPWPAVLAVVTLLTVIALPYRVVHPFPAWFETLTPVSYQGTLVLIAAPGVFLLARTLLGERSRWARAPYAGWARHLGDLTFGVFACHLLVLYVVRALDGTKAAGPQSAVAIVGQFLLVAVVAFLLSEVVSRIPGVRRIM